MFQFPLPRPDSAPLDSTRVDSTRNPRRQSRESPGGRSRAAPSGLQAILGPANVGRSAAPATCCPAANSSANNRKTNNNNKLSAELAQQVARSPLSLVGKESLAQRATCCSAAGSGFRGFGGEGSGKGSVRAKRVRLLDRAPRQSTGRSCWGFGTDRC